MDRKCERCGKPATQDLVCSTELLMDKSRVLKKGHRYNALKLLDLCDICSDEFFAIARDFMENK